MANEDRNMPAQPGSRDDMDDERKRGTEDVRGIGESEEDFDDTADSDEDEEEEAEEGEDEGTF